MKLSDEAINIISYACYPAHMQAAEDFIAKLEADRDEYRNLYHMGEAKIMSREAIIEQLSESELAKDVTRLEAELEDEQLRSDVYDKNFQKAYKENKQLEAELAKWTDGRKLVKYVEGLEAKLEGITCGECGKNTLECDLEECDRMAEVDDETERN